MLNFSLLFPRFLDSLGDVGRNQEIQIGGSDLSSEGSWVYPHTGHVVGFFHWAHNQPTHQESDDCLNIYLQYDHSQDHTLKLNKDASGYVDNCCTGCSVKRFLCELP